MPLENITRTDISVFCAELGIPEFAGLVLHTFKKKQFKNARDRKVIHSSTFNF